MGTSLFGVGFEAPRLPIRTRTAGRGVAPPEFAPASQTTSAAFAGLFHTIDALRTDDRPLVLQFAGADGFAPTDRVASAFARTAQEATEGRILYLDATGRADRAGPDLVRLFREGRSPAEIALPTREPRIGWATFGRTLALAGNEAARLIEAVRQGFSLAVLDCGAIDAARSVQPLARCADGTVLVTEADRTRSASIGLARTVIERAGGRLLGAVMNGGATEMPRWLAARI